MITDLREYRTVPGRDLVRNFFFAAAFPPRGTRATSSGSARPGLVGLDGPIDAENGLLVRGTDGIEDGLVCPNFRVHRYEVRVTPVDDEAPSQLRRLDVLDFPTAPRLCRGGPEAVERELRMTGACQCGPEASRVWVEHTTSRREADALQPRPHGSPPGELPSAFFGNEEGAATWVERPRTPRPARPPIPPAPSLFCPWW